jgi:hypothetical protein
MNISTVGELDTPLKVLPPGRTMGPTFTTPWEFRS